MKQIEAKTAGVLIKQYHYSGKTVQNTKLHLGVFDKQTHQLKGALSFGYPMNAKKTPGKLVKDGHFSEMLELNRMAMSDDAPKFSESQAIGLSIKWLKRFRKDIRWLLSFSDGKEGNVGIIYQATNWEYYGYNVSKSFYDLDGEIMHGVTSWHRHREKDTTGRTEREILCDTYTNVSKLHCKQHIYIYRLDKGIEVLRDSQIYPKKENEPLILERAWIKKDGVVIGKKHTKLSI